MLKFANQIAADTYAEMVHRLEGLKFIFGPISTEYVEAKESFDKLVEFIESNDGTIYRDGKLSLLFITWITCGIIWFESRDPAYEGFDCKPGTWSIHS